MADVELSSLGSVIKTAYEGESDTNAYTDTEKAKLGVLSAVSAIETALDGDIADATYVIHTSARFAFDIIGIYDLSHTSGTSTLAIKINGTDVTSLSALSVSSTPQDATASGANSVAVGDQITFVFSSGSSPVDLFGTLGIQRT